MKYRNIVVAISLMTLTLTANATIITGNGLQNGLDAITKDGAFANVNTTQASPDEVWTMNASGASVNTLVFEFAAFADNTTFGIYDIHDKHTRLEIFSGPNSAGSLSFSSNSGSNTFSVFNQSNLTLSSETFASTQFGYYLDSSASNGGGLFFSQAALNTDVANTAHGNTTDHMVAFEGDGSDKLDIFGTGIYGELAANEYILAWEDLAFPNSDYDYSDMVILVESVSPVPAPATLALFGFGLLGLGFVGRKKNR